MSSSNNTTDKQNNIADKQNNNTAGRFAGPKKSDIGPIPFSYEKDQTELLNTVMGEYIDPSKTDLKIFSGYNGQKLYEFRTKIRNIVFQLLVPENAQQEIFLSYSIRNYKQSNNINENVVAIFIFMDYSYDNQFTEYVYDINAIPDKINNLLSQYKEYIISEKKKKDAEYEYHNKIFNERMSFLETPLPINLADKSTDKIE